MLIGAGSVGSFSPLAVLGATGGANFSRATACMAFWAALARAVTAGIGHLGRSRHKISGTFQNLEAHLNCAPKPDRQHFVHP